MSYAIPDLTSTNPSYYVGNGKYRVVSPEQKIKLYDAVYLDTINLTIEGTVVTNMVRDLDWSYDEEDVDYTLMGQLQRLDEEFDKKIVTAIKIVKPFVLPYNINISYQKVYPVEVAYIRNNPTKNVYFTPDVFASMIEDIANLKVATAPIKDVQGITNAEPRLLEPDPNKEKPENFVSGEIWSVDVPNSVCIIHPVCGAFFRDSLKIKYKNYDQYLHEGTDYIITGLDYFRTKHTTNESGVYGFIVITTPIVQELEIEYHAYGGNATVYDVRMIQDTLANVYKYVKDSQLLTANTLGSAASFQDLATRVTTLETDMRRLAQEGRPTYAEDQKSLVKRISSTDTEFHWWTIGKLFKVAGSETVFTSEVGHIQIQSLYTKMMLDVTFAIDLSNPYKKFTVNSNMSLAPMGYIPYVNDSELENVIRPQFRIIWNTNTREASGIYLQIGLRLKTVAEDTLAIADLSGVESCFMLIPEVSEAVLPEDDTLTLPSGNHLWDSMNPDSRQETCLIPLEHGNVIWAGNEAMNRPESGWREIKLVHFLEKEVNINNIKTVTCLLEEDKSNRFPVKIDVAVVDEVLTGVSTFAYANKFANVVVRMSRNATTHEIDAVIQTEVSAGLSSNPLYLRYVVINS